MLSRSAVLVPGPVSARSRPSDPDKDESRELEPDEVLEGEVVHPERRPSQASRRLEVGWQESRYASALPSPDDLERYQAMLPDAPERLLAGGEREQAHRHEIESRLAAIDEVAMPRYYDGQKRGHAISLVLGAGYEAIMLVAVLKGYALEGIAGAATGLAAMFWALRRSPVEDVPDHDHPPVDSN